MACISLSKDTHLDSSWIIKNHQNYFTIILLNISIYTSRNYQHNIIFIHQLQYTYQHEHHRLLPMAREYSVCNAAVAALQFWTVDLKAHILSRAIDQVFNAFFYSTSTHMLHQQSDEILFGHFVTTLNATFNSKLALEDKGYKSGLENFNIPTPLQRTSRIHHVSSVKNTSFDPVPVTSCSTSDS